MPENSSDKKNSYEPFQVNQRLQQLLKTFGISLYKAADEAGIARGTVYSWFRRGNSPKVTDLEAICKKVFHMDLAEFFLISEKAGEGESEEEVLFLEQVRSLSDNQKKRLYETVNDFVQANANRNRPHRERPESPSS